MKIKEARGRPPSGAERFLLLTLSIQPIADLDFDSGLIKRRHLKKVSPYLRII